MGLREELDDLMRFEASSSKAAQKAMLEAEEGISTITDPYELIEVLFAFHKGLREAVFSLAERVERDERLLGIGDDD